MRASARSAPGPAPSRRCASARSCCRLPGLTVVTVDLSEIIFAANALADDAPEVKAKLDEIASYGRIPAHIKPDKIVRQAKWTIAVDRWIDENDCDASAIQCWRSLQDNFGCATCLTMSMMGEKLMPSACEVDVMGAISMYALALAAEAPSAILDWNNNYGREADKCVCTHCGNYPEELHRRDARNLRARRARQRARQGDTASAR